MRFDVSGRAERLDDPPAPGTRSDHPVRTPAQARRESPGDTVPALSGDDMILDPTVRFTVGYQLLGSGQVENALYVFRLSNRLFPGSANTWDSVGEALWRTGNLEPARSSCGKAIELDPEGPVDRNAHTMLKRMEAGGGGGGRPFR